MRVSHHPLMTTKVCHRIPQTDQRRLSEWQRCCLLCEGEGALPWCCLDDADDGQTINQWSIDVSCQGSRAWLFEMIQRQWLVQLQPACLEFRNGRSLAKERGMQGLSAVRNEVKGLARLMSDEYSFRLAISRKKICSPLLQVSLWSQCRKHVCQYVRISKAILHCIWIVYGHEAMCKLSTKKQATHDASCFFNFLWGQDDLDPNVCSAAVNCWEEKTRNRVS